FSPLLRAVEERWGGVVKMLLDQGADVNVTTKVDKQTPLHLAAQRGGFAVVQMLLDKGADVLATNSSGATPEDLASAYGRQLVVALL
ncbi:ankyrin repeat protein, partial [Baffinella frigidus]